MLWLEMSRDRTHGGGSWDFSLSLWSPSRKESNTGAPGTRWGFWDTGLKVRAGDSVLHLRGKDEKAAFVGFSAAETDGFETKERPPEPGRYSYADSFHRVLLKDFSAFPTPISLPDVFAQQDTVLRNYFTTNHDKPKRQKRRLFYVIQAGRLQCLNGAYLSEVDDELASILLGSDYSSGTDSSRPSIIDVQTGERIKELRVREGQQRFSDNVRGNYSGRCCFPQCPIVEQQFLIGAHIARWADVPHLRGNVSNGLCFCLMHDKAFEKGLFTITKDYRIAVNKTHNVVLNSDWCAESLLPFDSQAISCGAILPLEEAIKLHWTRTGFTPLHERD
jgi:putative restriction endonuclease